MFFVKIELTLPGSSVGRARGCASPERASISRQSREILVSSSCGKPQDDKRVNSGKPHVGNPERSSERSEERVLRLSKDQAKLLLENVQRLDTRYLRFEKNYGKGIVRLSEQSESVRNH
jgi:hypothetical protein